MRIHPLLAAAPIAVLLLGHAVRAQDNPDSRFPISEGSHWSLTETDCAIDTGWDGDVSMLITQHNDHRDIGLYDPNFGRLKADQIVDVSFGADERGPDAQTYPALSLRDRDLRGYVVSSDEALIAKLAGAKSFQFYRDGKELLTLELSGMREALAAMDRCLAALPAEDAGEMTAVPADQMDTIDLDAGMDAGAEWNAGEAAAAAADAAEAAAAAVEAAEPR